MKTIGVIMLLACAVISSARPQSEEEMQKMFMQTVASCQAAEGATDEDVQVSLNKALATTSTGKCLQTCIVEKTGMIENGKLSVEKSVGWTALKTGNNEQAMEITRNIATECGSPVVDNRCDTWNTIAECAMALAVKFGVDPKDVI